MAIVKPHINVRGEFCVETKPQQCAVIIFGASGDLAARKLIPSLFNLHRRKLLPKGFYVMGCARSEMDDEAFRAKMSEAIGEFVKQADPAERDAFLRLCYYTSGGYDEPAFYHGLAGRLAGLDNEHGTDANHVFYLSTPPTLYALIVEQLGLACLSYEEETGGPFARVIIEKPYGRDLDSALELERQLFGVLRERQIYRIDHYLGKETVQNILMFRFANSIFEPIWNRRYICHVRITVAESIGVGHRAGYFEQAGVLRDMFQNHMMQMLALVAMEPPASFDADRVRDEKVKLMRSVRPIEMLSLDSQIIRGQYAAGDVNGQHAPAYRQEPGVAPDSMIETYVAAKLYVDNWRWQGIPFFLRSGKRLARRYSEIAVTFNPIPHSMFNPIHARDLTPNVLVFNVQPDEGISLTMMAKHPGPKLCISALNMDFAYSEVFDEEPGEAYERLLLDCMLGDQTLFIRSDDVQVAWSLFTPVLDRWAEQGRAGVLHPYGPGSWGPKAATEMLRDDNCYWHNPLRGEPT